MRGLEDILTEYNPFEEPPKTLAHFRVAAAALDRLEDPKGKWVEHWASLGVNRKMRRAMLTKLKRRVGRRSLSELRRIAAMARAVRTKNKIAATLAAERKAELLDGR